MKPFVSPTETEQGFCVKGLSTFADQLRQLRNTLAHGKGQEPAGVIDATDRNMRLLRPWTHLIATAAGEVILYKDIA